MISALERPYHRINTLAVLAKINHLHFGGKYDLHCLSFPDSQHRPVQKINVGIMGAGTSPNAHFSRLTRLGSEPVPIFSPALTPGPSPVSGRGE